LQAQSTWHLSSKKMGDAESASVLLDASELATHSIQRLGQFGHGIEDVRIHAVRGDKPKALATLRSAENGGWRDPIWRYYRDYDLAA
jgi:hypothetical protein